MSETVTEDPTIDFICHDKRIEFPWVCIAGRFRRFEDKKYQNSAQIVDFSYETIQKLGEALSNPIAPIATDEDVKLLNWLQLKDFRDAYKLYDFCKPTVAPSPLCQYKEVKAYVRVLDAKRGFDPL